MMFCNGPRRAALIAIAVSVFLLVTSAAHGQPPPAQDETKAVVRISKQLIEDVLARKEIQATVPFDNVKVLGFRCHGVIEGQAKIRVDMSAAQRDGAFVVHSQGTAHTYVEGELGPLVVKGPAWGPFTTQTLVGFDGRRFTIVETTAWAEPHGELETVEGRHGGCVGRAVGRAILPAAKLLVPRAEQKVTPIGECILKNFVNDLGGTFVAKLNQTTAVEKSLNRLFPESKDWVFNLSTDSQFLQAAYGPRATKAYVLPDHPGRLKDVRLELWLHSTTTEARDLAKLSKEPLAKALVQKYLEAVVPELAALSENRSVDAVGTWLVISIGAPQEQ
jgi:hypothetical protein